jgi:tetratricopeptide (TPR) repeat protein
MNQDEFWRQMSHADVLLSQGRFEHAEDIIKRLLATGYDGPELLKMMALAKAGLGEYASAEELIIKVLSTHPEDPFLFYLLATIKGSERKYQESMLLIDDAIRMDPANADFFAYKANILLQIKEYESALSIADTALELDAENIDALNARSSALVSLGRKEEAFQTISKSLATDPNNASTHANVGWGMLHQGKSAEALGHFKEALKVNPMNEYAKSGMLEAMKARFPVYKYFLMAMLWLGKMKGNHQWAFIIGGYIVYRILISVAKNNESLMPFLTPFIALIFLFFISTWIFSPLMNLYLLANPYGRFTLSEDQKLSAKLVGLALVFSIAFLITYFIIIKNEGLLSSALLSFALMIPLGSMNNPYFEYNRKKLQYFTICITIFALLDSILAISHATFLSSIFYLPLISLVAYQWYVNYILIKE